MDNKNTLKTIAAVLALLLIGAIVYIFTLKDQMKGKEDEIVDVEQEKLLMQNELDSLEIEFKGLEEINLKQDSTLQATYLTLDQKNNEIRDLLNKSNISDSEVKRLRGQLNSLKSELGRFKSEVDRLVKENQLLRNTNDTLTMQNAQIRDTLTQVRGNYTSVKQEYDGAKNLIDNTLSISSFSITPLKVRKSGKEVVKDRAKSVNKLEVDFNLDPSASAENGPKLLYISIFKPNGELANFKNASTGQFTDKSGSSVKYSDKITVNYSNQSGAKVEFDWDYDEFVPGTYKINVYQNGFKIGEESRSLKK